MADTLSLSDYFRARRFVFNLAWRLDIPGAYFVCRRSVDFGMAFFVAENQA
jgi:hypothetical protein